MPEFKTESGEKVQVPYLLKWKTYTNGSKVAYDDTGRLRRVVCPIGEAGARVLNQSGDLVAIYLSEKQAKRAVELEWYRYVLLGESLYPY